MSHLRAFLFYYLLPFGIFIVFAALQSHTLPMFWGLITIGTFFALIGFYLMRASLKALLKKEESELAFAPAMATVAEPELAAQQKAPEVTTFVPPSGREEELEGKLKSMEEEWAAVVRQNNELQDQVKQKEATIQDLRFEVRSLIALSRDTQNRQDRSRAS